MRNYSIFFSRLATLGRHCHRPHFQAKENSLKSVGLFSVKARLETFLFICLREIKCAMMRESRRLVALSELSSAE